ncbi:hypothetical protein, partial [Plasmodium yoelii yoelii]
MKDQVVKSRNIYMCIHKSNLVFNSNILDAELFVFYASRLCLMGYW